ncbi:hypothetical protein CHUAL_007689 [Chamberlinius hualienensis]
MSKLHRLCTGIFILILVDIIWVSSAELTEYIFKTEHYNKPYFSTYIKSSMFAIYLFGFILCKSWRQQCLKQPTLQYVDPNFDASQPLGSTNNDDDTPMSDSMFVPIKFHDGGDKSSGTESDDQTSRLREPKSVHFSKLTEVRQLSDSQAEDALVARLSYTASLRAQEMAEKNAKKLGVKQVAKIAAMFTGIWFLGNIAYQEALADTEAGVVNALSSLSGMFTLLLASVFPSNSGDRITLSKLVAVLINVTGVVLICLADMKFESSVPSGAIWAIVGSLAYAGYLVLLRRKVENEDSMDIPMFFGFVGLFSMLTLWPGVLILHYSGVETVELPTAKQCILLSVNGLIGTVFSEFLWLWGCFLTSSLIATLSLSLVIPMTMAVDMIMKRVNYSPIFFIGTVPVFLAFFATSLLAHYENWDPVMECLQRLLHSCCNISNFRRKSTRLRDVDREQTESLIGIDSNEEHDA